MGTDLLPGARRRNLLRRLAHEIAKDVDWQKWNGLEEVSRPDDRVEAVAARPDDRVEAVAARPDDRVEAVAARPDEFLVISSRGRRVTRTRGRRARRGRLFRQLETPSLLELAGRVVVENGLDLSELPTHLAKNLRVTARF